MVLVLFLSACAHAPARSSTRASSEKSSTSDLQAGVVHVPAGGPFYVYWDKGSILNHFTPSGWIGDYGDIRMDDGSTEQPASGQTCLKFVYSAQGRQGKHWAGVYWQEPPDNWGNKDGGYDLTGMGKLVFQARGARGGERVANFKMGGISGDHPDSDSAETGPVDLTPDWKTYTIDLQGKSLTHIIGGFAWVANSDDNPRGFTIYLDDIRYEP
jgi:hypothetical protein